MSLGLLALAAIVVTRRAEDLSPRVPLSVGLGDAEARTAFRQRLGAVGQEIVPVDAMGTPDVVINVEGGALPTDVGVDALQGGDATMVPGEISGDQVFGQDGQWHAIDLYDANAGVYTTTDGLLLDTSGTIVGQVTPPTATVDVNGVTYTVVAQDAAGTIDTAEGYRILANGVVMNIDPGNGPVGALILPDGSQIAPSATVMDPTTGVTKSVGEWIGLAQQGVKTFGDIMKIFQGSGQAQPPSRPANVPPGSTYIGNGQWRTAGGQVIQGPLGGSGSSAGGLIVLGLLGVAGYGLLRRRSAA